MAAISVVNHTANTPSTAGNVDATSGTKNSWTPVAGRIAYACVVSRVGSGTVDQPTAAGNGQTWDVVSHVTEGTLGLTMFRAIVASPSAGTLVFDWGAQTQIALGWIVFEMVNLNTTDPEINLKTGTASAGTSLTVTFDNAFGSAWNGTLFAIALNTNGAITEEDGLLAVVPASQAGSGEVGASDGIRMYVGFRPTNDAAVSATFSSADACGIAVELVQDGSDVTAGGSAGRSVPRGTVY